MFCFFKFEVELFALHVNSSYVELNSQRKVKKMHMPKLSLKRCHFSYVIFSKCTPHTFQTCITCILTYSVCPDLLPSGSEQHEVLLFLGRNTSGGQSKEVLKWRP